MPVGGDGHEPNHEEEVDSHEDQSDGVVVNGEIGDQECQGPDLSVYCG